METTINGRKYTVEARDMSDLSNLVADLVSNGFDGMVYYLTGKRGAVKMAYRSVKSGQFVIVA